MSALLRGSLSAVLKQAPMFAELWLDKSQPMKGELDICRETKVKFTEQVVMLLSS